MRRIVAALVALGVTAAAVPARAYKFQINEDSWVNVGALIQAQAQFTQNEAGATKDEYSKDFFLRRVRLILSAGITKYLEFFVDTDMPNLGKNGDWGVSGTFFVQDAFGTFKLRDEFMVDAGMILLPFTRHSMMGATGLNGIDYHSALIKFPDGSTKVWRDAGVQVRGYLVDKRLQYRFGVFSGSQDVVLQKDANEKAVAVSNPNDVPRLTGHVRYNLLGTETDFFPKGIYFTKDPIVSIGAGVDWTPSSILRKPVTLDANQNVTARGQIGDHLGVAGDLFVDYPVGADQEAVFQGTFLYYHDGAAVKTTGYGALIEAGYRWRMLEPVFQCDSFLSDAAFSNYLAVRGGLDWWIWKHNANVKFEFAAVKQGDGKAHNLDGVPFTKQVTIQTQMYF